MRIGHGYDVHRLTAGRKLILGGVEIPYEKGLLGHSDADVLAHAVADALLGAAALGDIGALFPDTDSRFEGADSLRLLAEVAVRIREAGYVVSNLDATILAQAPQAVQLIFGGSGIVPAAVFAIILNIVLPKDEKTDVERAEEMLEKVKNK